MPGYLKQVEDEIRIVRDFVFKVLILLFQLLLFCDVKMKKIPIKGLALEKNPHFCIESYA
jgi:hypothetical protein